MKRSTIVLMSCAACLVPAAFAAGALIEPGTYRLHNHPDTGTPFAHGLQLDELFDVTPGNDRFTFDFDAPGAAMFLDYDGDAITISGIAFGGLENGGLTYDPAFSSMIQIQLTYDLSGPAPGDDDIIVDSEDLTHVGAVSWLQTGQSIPLFDFAGDDAFAFRFGDENDNLGHRGFDGLSGWGGLAHGIGGTRVDGSEWIFTAQRVPGPASLAMLAGGLVMGRRRRRH